MKMQLFSVRRAAAADFLSRFSNQAKLFGVVLFGLFLWSTKQPTLLYAFGCDSFGYARQAQLFREHGLIKGLDTRINAPDAQRLIDVARLNGGDRQGWQDLVAPLCHHYKESVHAIVLQYPPGTGLMLAMFAEPYSLRGLLLLSMALAAIAVCLPIAVGNRSTPALISGALLFGLIAWTVKQPDAFASYSVIASIGLASLAAMFLYLHQAVASPAGRQRQCLSGALGACCAMLVAVRLPNAFIICGVASVVMFGDGGLYPIQLRKIWHRVWPFALAFLAVAVPLVLYPNYINAGGIFQTTYNSIDAAPPVVSKDVIFEGFGYYYAAGFSSPAVIVVTVLLALGACERIFIKPRRTESGLFFGALIAFVLSLSFFVTHPIRIPYYLLPACIFSLVALYSDFVLRSEPNSLHVTMRRVFLVAAPIAALSVVLGLLYRPHNVEIKLPSHVLDSQSVLWSDFNSGTIYYYTGKYSAKIAYAGECHQNNVIVALAKQGINQYFVQDSPLMTSTIDRLKLGVNLEASGELIADKAYPILALTPAANPDAALKRCDSGTDK